MTDRGLEERSREIFSESLFKGEVRFSEPMSNHTSLRIGGCADIFIKPEDLSSLQRLRANLKKNQVPFFAMGGGTNILVREGGVDGAVVSFGYFKNIDVSSEDADSVKLYVEAGTPLRRLVSFSSEKGYSGIEGLAGIPGTVGGAICGNAGAFGYEMKDVLLSVTVMVAGGIEVLDAGKMVFEYRSSSIRPDEMILGAEVYLKKDSKENVSAKVDDFLKRKRERQPIGEPSAGCVFKNPPGLSAGKLIDEAGCKGMRMGNVEVSGIHANFFVNRGGAKAFDFIRLMEQVAHKVAEKFGVVLEPEIRIIGRDVN
jgi:UDP-N-acetylmuramate dehydrogenase